MLHPLIQALLILSVLVLLVLIYLNPAAGGSIVAFLLALRGFFGGGSSGEGPKTPLPGS
jgi:hypothetical protein